MLPLSSILNLSLPSPESESVTALPSGSLAFTVPITVPTARLSSKVSLVNRVSMLAASSSLITLMVISSIVVLVPSETSNVITKVELASKSKLPVRVTSPVSETFMSSLPLPLREYERALPS